MSIEIHAADRDLLEKAIQKLGLKYNRLKNGTFQVFAKYGAIYIGDDSAVTNQYTQDTLNQIKQAYAKTVVETAAEQYGFTYVEDEVNVNQAHVRIY